MRSQMHVLKISRQLNRYMSRQSGMNLTGLFNSATNKVDKKLGITPKMENALSRYYTQKLHDHTLLEARRQNRLQAETLCDGKVHFDERSNGVKQWILKVALISGAQGGGAAIAGVPFTLLETLTMLNTLWSKLEIIAESYHVEPYAPFEKAYILNIIALGLSDQSVDKAKAYKNLMHLELELMHRGMSLLEQEQYLRNEALAQEVSQMTLRPLVSTKLTQTVPFIGFGLGALTSGSMLQRCLLIGNLMYGRRFLLKETSIRDKK